MEEFNSKNSLLDHINKLPEGYSEGIFNNAKYGITKSIFNNGKSYKIYAEELQATNFISLNYYVTDKQELLKPCEMPEQKVIEFLKKKSNIDTFLSNVFAVVEPSVEKYLERGFTNLSINFGCTGGQHRSVYSADRLAEYLKKKYNVTVALQHIEQELKSWVNG